MLWFLLACAHTPPPVAAVSEAPARPRNVILMIGDGMGPQQLGLLEVYARLAPGSPYPEGRTAFTALAEAGPMGLSLHHPADGLLTDSACSATQLALGRPSRNELIGVDADGARQDNLREQAARRGMATGVVSDTRLTHATPAAFLAHVPSRVQEPAIAEQIVASDVQVALSGGWKVFAPRDDGRDLLAEARSAGFDVARTADELAAAGPRVLGLFGERSMPDAIAAAASPEVPSLAELTSAALDRLDDDPDGFFLMVEGGQIDWAAHANDAGWMLAELRRFDAAVAVASAFAAAHPDTLLVVTADHETGGFGLSPSEAMPIPTTSLGGVFTEPYTPGESPLPADVLTGLADQRGTVFDLLDRHDALPEAQRTPAGLVADVRATFGLDLDEAAAAHILAADPMAPSTGFWGDGRYARAGALSRALADQRGVVWNTAGHTHTPVPVFARGPGAEAFGGILHHVELGRRLSAALPEEAP